MKKLICYIVIIILLGGCSKDDFIFTPTEQTEGFYTSDIDLFWQAYDYMSPKFTENNFQNIYINNGTAGLKDYASQKKLASGLYNVFRSKEYQNYYLSIRTNTMDYKDGIQKSKKAFQRFQDLRPEVELFDVYFLIGALGAGGRVSQNGLLIAVEMFSKTDKSNTADLSEWLNNVICTKDYIPSIVVHELVHKQQIIIPRNKTYTTLLEQALLEGMADFIACYLLPDEPFINQHIYDYGNAFEEQLWDEFKIEMDKNYKDTEWLYTGSINTSKGYPADLGYYIGYKILEAYSENFDNIPDAINSMLNISDYYLIYANSSYDEKVKQTTTDNILNIP